MPRKAREARMARAWCVLRTRVYARACARTRLAFFPHAQIAAASPSMEMAREVRHPLPGRAATSLPWGHSPLHVLAVSPA